MLSLAFLSWTSEAVHPDTERSWAKFAESSAVENSSLLRAKDLLSHSEAAGKRRYVTDYYARNDHGLQLAEGVGG
jgi:hypothetical protein